MIMIMGGRGIFLYGIFHIHNIDSVNDFASDNETLIIGCTHSVVVTLYKTMYYSMQQQQQ